MSDTLGRLFGRSQKYNISKVTKNANLTKTPDAWVVIHNLKLSSDGGILDPDDRLNDVADDREQIIAIYEEQTSPYHHHNGGDGTSASSVGTESPDIFQIEVNHNTLPNPNVGIKVKNCDYSDVEITGNHMPMGITPLQVRRGSEPALNRLSPVSSNPDPTKRWSAAVIVGDTCDDAKPPRIRRTNSTGQSEDEEDYDDDSRGEGSGEEKSVSSRLSRGSGRLSILGSGSEMARWAEAADRQLYKNIYSEMHDGRREPLGSSGTSPDQSRDPESETSSLGEDREVVIILKNETGPLGIHVVPDYDSSGRDTGLVIQGIETGGRIDRDGRLQVGDRIVEISGRSLVHVSFQKAQEIFKDALKNQEIKLKLVKCHGHNLYQNSQGTLDSVSSSGASSSRGGNPPPPKKPPPPVYPKPNGLQSSVRKEREHEGAALVEGEERGGLITKVATVTPTKKVPAAARPVSSAPLASNTRKIGRKIAIQLTKGPEGLGFSVTTRDNPAGGNCPIYIKNILPKGAAIQDGRLKPGDRLLEVNGLEMTGKSQTEAVQLLRNTPPGGLVDLVVSRQEIETIPAAPLPRKLPPDQSDGDGIFPWKHREVLTFDIPLNDTGSAGLGVSVKGKSTASPNGPVDLGIFVKSVINGGAASKDGRLCTNDQLVNINGISLLSMTNTQAMETLRRAMTQGEGPNALPNAITLTVARRIPSSQVNGTLNGSGDDSSVSYGSHDRSDSVLSSGSSLDNLLCLNSSIKQNGVVATPDNSASETSETTVIFKPNQTNGSSDSLNNNSIGPDRINTNSTKAEEGLNKQMAGRNPVVDRLMSQNGGLVNNNAAGLRNESYLKASHESWGGAQLQQAIYGTNDPRLRIANPQFPNDKVVIEDEYSNSVRPKQRSRSVERILESPHHHAHPPKDSKKDEESEKIDTSQLSLNDEEKDANFYRDGFGRQSISEKRHAQLDARNTDTYQRNKKLKEKEKKGSCEELDLIGVEASSENLPQEPLPKKIEVEERAQQSPTKQIEKTGPKSRSSSHVGNGTVSLIRSNSAESLLRPHAFQNAGNCQSPGCTYHSVSTGDSTNSSRGIDEATQSSSSVHASNCTASTASQLGPSLGMRKSSSLESLQTMVQELAKEATGHYGSKGNKVGSNGGVPTRGRGCNESFRAAVDRSYDGPPGVVPEACMETVEEESESGGSSQGTHQFQRGGPLELSSRQPSISHEHNLHALQRNSSDDMIHAYNRKDPALKSVSSGSSGKKKGGLLKGLGSVFKFGKHRKITQETIQKLTREQMEQEAERLKARKAAQEEQERIQEQYRKLLEQQQRQQQQAQQTSQQSVEGGKIHVPSLSQAIPPPPLPHHGHGPPVGQHHHHNHAQGPLGNNNPNHQIPNYAGMSPSRQERMQQLRAQHQKKHQERQGHYPKDEQEEWYEKDLKNRIDKQQVFFQQQRPLPTPPPLLPLSPHFRSPIKTNRHIVNSGVGNYIYHHPNTNNNHIYGHYQSPERISTPPKMFTAHAVLRRTYSLYTRQRPHHDQLEDNHVRSNSFDIYKEMERPGSRRGIADPSKYSHYVNYKEIQQHLRQFKSQEQQIQTQQQHQPPQQPVQRRHQTDGTNGIPVSHHHQHFNGGNVNQIPSSIKTIQPPGQWEKRPNSNYFEYESVQALYHASHQTTEINTSSLPRRTNRDNGVNSVQASIANKQGSLPHPSHNQQNTVNTQGVRSKIQAYHQTAGNDANNFTNGNHHPRTMTSQQRVNGNNPHLPHHANGQNYPYPNQLSNGRRDPMVPGSKV